MSENNDNSNKNGENQNFKDDKISIEKKSIEKTPDHKSSEYIDIVLSRKGAKVVDSETLVKEAQKRIWSALKQGYEYNPSTDESEKFLRDLVSSRVNMIVLYVDLVGSTDITLSLPEEKVAIIISSFAQEMAEVIRQHDGYVLKFVGDAVIGYFIAEALPLLAADNAVNSAKTMVTLVEKGLNPILNQYDYPELKIKIGMDFGKNIIVRYGSDKEKSHVDILGPAMNIASKIQHVAEPNQILIGEDVYTRIHPSIQKSFEKVVWTKTKWKYHDRETGKLYPVYAYIG
ncbi:MAG: adenylate/guanylate cyclase domain-containing protein [Nitrosopumilaceae archaeon]